MVAKWVKLAATSAGAGGQKQWEPEASEQQNAEGLTVHPCGPGNWKAVSAAEASGPR